MAMPEAAMHEHNRAVFRQHDVRPSGQILPVQAEPKPHGMQDPADRQFGGGVLPADRRHVAGSNGADDSLLSHNACVRKSPLSRHPGDQTRHPCALGSDASGHASPSARQPGSAGGDQRQGAVGIRRNRRVGTGGEMPSDQQGPAESQR